MTNKTGGNSWSISRILGWTGNPSAWNKYDFLGCNRRFGLGFWCRSKESPSRLLRFSIVFELHFKSKIYQDLRKIELDRKTEVSSFDFDFFCVPLCFDKLFSRFFEVLILVSI